MTSASASIPVGYKKTEVGVIPEDWIVQQLGEYSDITKLAGFEYTKYFNSYKDFGEIIVVRGTNIKNNRLDLSDVRTIPKSTSNQLPRSKLNSGDLVFAYVGTIGPVALIQESNKFHLGPNTARITCLDQLNPEYLFEYFKSDNIKNEIRLHTSIGAQPSLSMKKIRNFNIILCSIKEQKLIASSLKSIDALLQFQELLLTKKRCCKLATMQELLTGKTRLPGFSGEWDVISLGQIGEISGAGVDKKIIDGETPVRLVNYLDVYNRSFIYSNELEHYVTAPPSKAIKCSVRKGDVFFTPTSEVRDDIAVSAIAMEDIPDGTYSYHVVRFRIQEDWDLYYRAYAFQTKSFLDQAAVLSDGSGTRYVITLPNFRKLKVLVPSKREQQAIGKILSDMDAEIAALEQRLEKAKAIKQGMMQQLLTGRIRLVEPSTPTEASA